MSRPFAITTAKDTVNLGKSGTGHATFTVSNSLGRIALGRGRVVPGDPVQEDWYTISDDIERTLRPEQTTEYQVKVKVPDGTPTGDYKLRFDMILLDNQDEVAVEGPTVTVKHEAAEPGKKPFPWWIVGVAAAAVILIAVAVTLFVVFSGNGGPVVVPDVRTLTFDAAAAKLTEVGLKGERGETTLRNDVEPEIVLEQDPPPDTEAAKKSTVLLTVSAADVVNVPDVTDKFFDAAKRELEEAGLSASRGEAVLRENTPKDIVVAQSPAGDQQAPRGTVVVLSVTNESVSIPDIKGRILDDNTASSIARAGLYVTYVSQQDQVQPFNEILALSPAGGELVAKGSSIKLTLARTPQLTEDRHKAVVDALLNRHGLLPPAIWRRHDVLLNRDVLRGAVRPGG